MILRRYFFKYWVFQMFYRKLRYWIPSLAPQHYRIQRNWTTACHLLCLWTNWLERNTELDVSTDFSCLPHYLETPILFYCLVWIPLKTIKTRFWANFGPAEFLFLYSEAYTSTTFRISLSFYSQILLLYLENKEGPYGIRLYSDSLSSCEETLL